MMIVSNAYTNKYLTTAQVTTYYIIQKKNKIKKEVCICRKFFVQLRKGAYKALDR